MNTSSPFFFAYWWRFSSFAGLRSVSRRVANPSPPRSVACRPGRLTGSCDWCLRVAFVPRCTAQTPSPAPFPSGASASERQREKKRGNGDKKGGTDWKRWTVQLKEKQCTVINLASVIQTAWKWSTFSVLQNAVYFPQSSIFNVNTREPISSNTKSKLQTKPKNMLLVCRYEGKGVNI